MYSLVSYIKRRAVQTVRGTSLGGADVIDEVSALSLWSPNAHVVHVGTVGINIGVVGWRLLFALGFVVVVVSQRLTTLRLGVLFGTIKICVRIVGRLLTRLVVGFMDMCATAAHK